MGTETVFAYGKPQMVLLRTSRPVYGQEAEALRSAMREIVDKTPDLKGLPVCIVCGDGQIEIVSLKPEPLALELP